MKKLNLFLLLIFSIIFVLPVCAQKAKSQSAIYDAIAIMNARHGINVVMRSDVGGYHAMNPLTGTNIGALLTTPLPDNLTNDPNQSLNIILAVLRRNAGLADTAGQATIKKAYQDNPFLKSILDTKPKAFTDKDNTVPNYLGSINLPPVSGTMGVNLVNNLANGVSDFLIKRANQEITVSIIQRLQTFLNRYPEFKILFPKAVALIQPIQPYDYAKTLDALKAALKDDLDHLPGRLQNLYALPRYQAINAKAPVLTLIFAASNLSIDLNGKFNMSKALHDLDTAAFLKAQNNYASFIRIVCNTSNNLRKKNLNDDEAMEYPYMTLGEIDSVTHKNINNRIELARYFLGLLYQQESKIPIWTASGQQNASSLLAAWGNEPEAKFAGVLDTLASAGTKLQYLDSLLTVNKTNDMIVSQTTGKPFFSSERFTNYSQLVTASLQLAQPFVNGSDASQPFKQDFKEITQYWPAFSKSGIDMVSSFSSKDYSLAMQNLSQMLTQVSDFMDDQQSDKAYSAAAETAVTTYTNTEITQIKDSIKTINTQLSQLSANQTRLSNTMAMAKQQRLERALNILNDRLDAVTWENGHAKKVLFTLSKVIDYLQLFAALSEAGNSQEVESLLETYALPAGSSRIKKVTDFNIALNAYVGAFFGRDETKGSGFTNSYGLTAPIGFTISHGFGKAGSVSALAGIFDVGSIIRYKLDNQGNYQQNINLVGLISPSVHFVYGLPFYLPLSIGVGHQWTSPNATSVNNIHFESHFNAFIAVDIPLFNLTAVRKNNNKQ